MIEKMIRGYPSNNVSPFVMSLLQCSHANFHGLLFFTLGTLSYGEDIHTLILATSKIPKSLLLLNTCPHHNAKYVSPGG